MRVQLRTNDRPVALAMKFFGASVEAPPKRDSQELKNRFRARRFMVRRSTIGRLSTPFVRTREVNAYYSGTAAPPLPDMAPSPHADTATLDTRAPHPRIGGKVCVEFSETVVCWRLWW